MSYTVKIEDDHFKTYFHEIKVSLEPCDEVKQLGQYFQRVKVENKESVQKLYGGEGPYDNKNYHGESSNGTVSSVKTEPPDDFSMKVKLDPEHDELLPSDHPVLVGCSSCYRYMMVPNSNLSCFFCGKMCHIVEELMTK